MRIVILVVTVVGVVVWWMFIRKWWRNADIWERKGDITLAEQQNKNMKNFTRDHKIPTSFKNRLKNFFS